MAAFSPKKDDITIVLCGAAGQGIQTVEQFLTHLFKQAGYHLFSTKEYMSRVRGGSNSTEIRISSRPVDAFVRRMDILIPLDRAALEHVSWRIADDTIIIGEKNRILEEGPTAYEIVDVEFTDIAKEIGGVVYANTVAVGMIAALFGIERDLIYGYIDDRFGKLGEEIIAHNRTAADRGYGVGEGLARDGLKMEVSRSEEVGRRIIVNGGDVVSLGAISGGCDFVASYPMTPSTSVFTFLARHGRRFGIVVEQAEDEIAAMNMVIGAWYAGGRGMVSTSGGGFALMVEGLSLAGCIESPVVIHLGQRPGPATGLPTRTEQGDLLFALHAGHGEFPRAIFAPGTLRDAFELTHRAFETADAFQVPVFILTDQYFIDSYYDTEPFDAASLTVNRRVVETGASYTRYAFTESGVSPRGIPGGEGLVIVDSDEHTQEGHITEDRDVRTGMVDKRLKKLEGLAAEAVPPEIIGPPDAATMVICWGSTMPIVREAVTRLGRDDIAVAYFKQVYPVAPVAKGMLGYARRRIMVEQNATGQFEHLLARETGIRVDAAVHDYSGLAFTVEDLAGRLADCLA